MEISTELYMQAMDRTHGEEEQAKWEAEMELRQLAEQGNEQAINELSHRAY